MPFFMTQAIRFLLYQMKSLQRATHAGLNLLPALNSRTQLNSPSNHKPEIAERVRVDAYYEAIQRSLQVDQSLTEPGTGAVTLALFAAEQSPDRMGVRDHFDFIHLAQKIASSRGIDCIEFVNHNSREFMPEERAELLVHEQIGDGLLTGHMLDSLIDLKKRCLKPDGRILPAQFEVFIEPIQLHWGRAVSHLWNRPEHAVDFNALRDSREADGLKPPTTECLLLESSSADCLLCSPKPIMRFDLNQLTSTDELEGVTKTCKQTVRAGRMDGLALYVRARFDEDIAFDTSPFGRFTHRRFRLFRTPVREVAAGETIEIALDLKDPTDLHSWKLTLHPAQRSGSTKEAPATVML